MSKDLKNCNTNTNIKNPDCNSCEISEISEINELVNIIYTLIPAISEYKVPYSLDTIVSPTASSVIKKFNFNIKLPCESCNEIRILWPLVWMINPIATKIKNSYNLTLTDTGTESAIVEIKFILNVLSSKIIKGPTQTYGILNKSEINNSLCICNETAAKWDYTFYFTLTGTGSAGSTVTPTISSATINLSSPHNSSISTILVTPVGNSSLDGKSEFTLSIPMYASEGNTALINAGLNTLLAEGDTVNIVTILQGFGITIPSNATIITVTSNGTILTIIYTVGLNPPIKIEFTPIIGYIPVYSPAHYISFVYSCEDKYRDYWTATNIESLNV